MADNYTILTEVGQTLLDVAVQEYGDASSVVMLMQDNATALPDINADLAPGTALSIRSTPEVADAELMSYFRQNKIRVNNGE